MGMTIDTAINVLGMVEAHGVCIEAKDIAVETMRKYQQLQADYENRLKADMVAMLTEIQLEYSEYASVWMQWNDTMSKEKIAHEALKASKDKMIDLLQQKIDKLKGNKNG